MAKRTEYTRQTTSSGSMRAAQLAAPVMGGFKALDTLSSTITNFAIKRQEALDNAEYNEHEAKIRDLLRIRSTEVNEVKGKSVLADPNADTSPDDPRGDMTVSLLEREHMSLAIEKEEFLSQASNSRVRKALSKDWNDRTARYLDTVAKYQMSQEAEYIKQAQEANIEAVTAETLTLPAPSMERYRQYEVDILAATNGDEEATNTATYNTVLTDLTNKAQENLAVTKQWIAENKTELSGAVPGIMPALTTMLRQETSFQRQEIGALKAQRDVATEKAEKEAGGNMTNLVWDTMMGKKGTDISSTMQTLRDNTFMDFKLKNSLLKQMETFRTQPVSSEVTHYIELKQDAMVGELDETKAQDLVANRILSVEDYQGLSELNGKALEKLDAPAKQSFAEAKQYFKDRFQTASKGFVFFKTDKEKIQNRMALNILTDKYWNAEPGKRQELFKTEHRADGTVFMPEIEAIYQHAATTDVKGYTTTDIKASKAGIPLDQAFKEMDAILKD